MDWDSQQTPGGIAQAAPNAKRSRQLLLPKHGLRSDRNYYMPSNLAEAMIRLLGNSSNEGLATLNQVLRDGEHALASYGRANAKIRSSGHALSPKGRELPVIAPELTSELLNCLSTLPDPWPLAKITIDMEKSSFFRPTPSWLPPGRLTRYMTLPKQ